MAASLEEADPGKIDLSAKERVFLEQHPTIVLGTDKLWHPYVIVSPEGNITGYDAEVLDLINRVSGAHFSLKVGVWKEMLEEAKQRHIDGLSSGAAVGSRKSYLNYSDTYVTVSKMVIVASDNPKNIHLLEDLKGKTISIMQGNLADEKSAKHFPGSTIKHFPTVEKVLKAVISGEADATFANGSTLFLANELGMPYFKRVAILPEKLKLVLAVRNDWPEAISIINKALKKIGKERLEALQHKWFWQDQAMPLIHTPLKLNEDQKSYLRTKGKIRFCLDPDWMPLEAIRRGKASGAGSDFVQLFSEQIGTPFTLVPTDTWDDSLSLLEKGECDIIPMMMPSRSRSSRYFFTTPYLSIPIVLATSYEKPYIANLHEIGEKSIGVVRNYVFRELLQDKYPNIHFVEFDSIREGLEAVCENKIFGFVDNLYVVGHQIQKHFISQLKITGKLGESLQLSVGISKKDARLLPIMQQTIDSLEPSLIEKIISQWLSVAYEKEPDYTLLWEILAIVFVVVMLLFYRHYILSRYNRQLKREVAKKVEELRKKDEILLGRLRMAAMGEMLSMIAHQWRQPLGAISSTILGINMRLKSGSDDLTQEAERRAFFEFLELKLGKINDYVAYLSGTVDDFRTFFKPNKEKESVPITAPVERAIAIMEQSLQERGITIQKEYHSQEKVLLFHNEVMQAILNLLRNSEDVFAEKKREDPLNRSITRSDGDRHTITVCDNGGGIPEEILPQIFEPYFSTKDEMNGVGLGLYMSKMIIEGHHKGVLSVRNEGEGSCFEIGFF
jgi:polar amino acid transport system substrate-binding protein